MTKKQTIISMVLLCFTGTYTFSQQSIPCTLKIDREIGAVAIFSPTIIGDVTIFSSTITEKENDEAPLRYARSNGKGYDVAQFARTLSDDPDDTEIPCMYYPESHTIILHSQSSSKEDRLFLEAMKNDPISK